MQARLAQTLQFLGGQEDCLLDESLEASSLQQSEFLAPFDLSTLNDRNQETLSHQLTIDFLSGELEGSDRHLASSVDISRFFNSNVTDSNGLPWWKLINWDALRLHLESQVSVEPNLFSSPTIKPDDAASSMQPSPALTPHLSQGATPSAPPSPAVLPRNSPILLRHSTSSLKRDVPPLETLESAAVTVAKFLIPTADIDMFRPLIDRIPHLSYDYSFEVSHLDHIRLHKQRRQLAAAEARIDDSDTQTSSSSSTSSSSDDDVPQEVPNSTEETFHERRRRRRRARMERREQDALAKALKTGVSYRYLLLMPPCAAGDQIIYEFDDKLGDDDDVWRFRNRQWFQHHRLWLMKTVRFDESASPRALIQPVPSVSPLSSDAFSNHPFFPLQWLLTRPTVPPSILAQHVTPEQYCRLVRVLGRISSQCKLELSTFALCLVYLQRLLMQNMINQECRLVAAGNRVRAVLSSLISLGS